jgi:hypothetical protein
MVGVINFPKWRENCTPVEKLREVLQYAESHPEDVRHLLILCENVDGKRQQHSDGSMTTAQAIGMLELAKLDCALEWGGD